MKNVAHSNSESKEKMGLGHLQAINSTVSDIKDKTGFPYTSLIACIMHIYKYIKELKHQPHNTCDEGIPSYLQYQT
jgi:hypothetical protein